MLIDLSEREAECIVCGADATGDCCGVPMYEGRVVPVDYAGEWAGFDACRRCYDLYMAGGPTALEGVTRECAGRL